MRLSGSKLAQFLDLLELLEATGREMVRLARRRVKPGAPVRRGATLRPGVDTPLWLALAASIRPHLHDYGAKSRLARELRLDPSRVSQFFVTRTAQPDAERTLELLLWLTRRKQPLLNKQRLPGAGIIGQAGRGRTKSARSRRGPRWP